MAENINVLIPRNQFFRGPVHKGSKQSTNKTGRNASYFSNLYAQSKALVFATNFRSSKPNSFEYAHATEKVAGRFGASIFGISNELVWKLKTCFEFLVSGSSISCATSVGTCGYGGDLC